LPVFAGLVLALALFQLVADIPHVLAMAGTLAVVGSLVPASLGRLAAGIAAAVAAVSIVDEVSAATLAFSALLVVGALLGRTASARFPGLHLIAAAASADRLARESVLLDERARTELTRARRYQRPFSVIAVTVDCDQRRRARERLVTAAQAMAGTLRVTDVVGVTEDGEAVAVLPDTERGVVADLVARVGESIAATGATGRVGYASFPDDALTWQELKDAAREHTVALQRIEPAPTYALDLAVEVERVAG
jgi:hypothetical protein